VSTYYTMVVRANALFHPDNLEQLDPNRVAPGTPFGNPLRERGIARSDRELAFFMSWPEGLREALQAIVHSALSRTPRLPVTFAWAPGYDYELTMYETPGTAEGPGGITILLRSRYPADIAQAQL
jgi:hypothetical protein